jgi:hypothetical protein
VAPLHALKGFFKKAFALHAGDLLNKYLYLTGRVNVKAIEVTIQNLIGSGMAPKTENNPYLGFVYTSFQERATKISHGHTAKSAGALGDDVRLTPCSAHCCVAGVFVPCSPCAYVLQAERQKIGQDPEYQIGYKGCSPFSCTYFILFRHGCELYHAA